MDRFRARYGASAGHLVAQVVGGALSAYAVTRVPNLSTLVSIGLWFAFMLVAHDLLLFPVYASADRAMTWIRGRTRPRIPWTNYVRVPTVLSGLLLLAWFPLVLRVGSGFARASGRSVDPFLLHWVRITVVLFGVSALFYVLRVVRGRRV